MPDFPIEPSHWTIDPDHSAIEFSVRRLVVSRVHGGFESFSGSIDIAPDGAVTVTADIDTTSLTTHNARRDAHLRSADFLDVAAFPRASFASTGVTVAPSDEHTMTLTGDLTLHGITKPVTLAVEWIGRNGGMGTEEVVGFEATTEFRRQDFGITIDVPLESGDKVVGDEVSLRLAISAIRERG